MFEKPKSETPTARSHGAETIVGTSVKLKGNIKSDGDIIVDGVITGEIKTKGAVMVGKNANILASVKAANVTVSGVVQGNIEATDRLEITESGKVLGDIATSVLSIAPGAVFTGKSQMSTLTPEKDVEPVMETEEPETKEEKKAEK